MIRNTLLVLLTVALCVPAVACTAPSADPPGDPATLRVLAQELSPFYHRDEQGSLAGFEHLILQSFAEAQGLTLEVIWVAVCIPTHCGH